MAEDELKVSREGVLAAAKSCPQAKAVLEKLFPAVFVDEVEFWVPPEKFVSGTVQVDKRVEGKFRGKGLYLCRSYKWTIETDEFNVNVLVGRKRKS